MNKSCRIFSYVKWIWALYFLQKRETEFSEKDAETIHTLLVVNVDLCKFGMLDSWQ